MEKWVGQVAVVTGASSGIGAAIVKDLVKAGCIVVGLARRVEKVEELRNQVKEPGKLYARHCDVSKLESVKEAFDWIEAEVGGISILVNNAGISKNTTILTENNEDGLIDIINTNVLGLVFCTKEAYKSIAKRNDFGYIVNVNSTAGHRIPPVSTGANIYAPSKFAVTAATQVLIKELADLKNSKVRVTSISPGLVDTEILDLLAVRDFVKDLKKLKPEDISAQIMHILSTPYDVHIQELLVTATSSI